MSEKIDYTPDNPPAFPTNPKVKVGNIEFRGEDGMTLRDYFAAAALQGLIMNDRHGYGPGQAQAAYKFADAMLAERERK